MRGCNEARPSRHRGGQGLPLQRPSGRERENPRSERSEPAALKVQLDAVRASTEILKAYCGTLSQDGTDLDFLILAIVDWKSSKI